MEGVIRKPGQGITNIVRFNWHFYVGAAGAIGLLLLAHAFAGAITAPFILLAIGLALAGTTVSLAVSYYVYDRSGLYELDWLKELTLPPGARVVNIHAGFDETSALLARRYPSAHLQVLDFYNPEQHTEVSIKRARRAYPSYPGTRTITTSNPALQPQSIDAAFVLLSAHEIRNRSERTTFFTELGKALQEDGVIVVVEHLRDGPNFLAYTIGSLHFFSKKEWRITFEGAGLRVAREQRLNPFITAYFLQSNGTAS